MGATSLLPQSTQSTWEEQVTSLQPTQDGWIWKAEETERPTAEIQKTASGLKGLHVRLLEGHSAPASVLDEAQLSESLSLPMPDSQGPQPKRQT